LFKFARQNLQCFETVVWVIGRASDQQTKNMFTFGPTEN